MTRYFHFAPLRLGPGSIIEPGNWGRLIKRYSIADGAPWLLARELIFEQLRPEGKPARMSGCFALTTRIEADAYRAAVDPNYQSVLHEVDIVDATRPVHVGGLSFLDMPQMGPSSTRCVRLRLAIGLRRRVRQKKATN